MLGLGITSLLGGLASSGIAAWKNKQATNQANKDYQDKQNLIKSAQDENTAWFKKQYYSDVTQATDFQNTFRKMKDQMQEQQKQNEALAAMNGSSAATRLAAQDSVNKAYANAAAEVASGETARKDNMVNNWQNSMNNYYLQRLSLQNPASTILANEANQWGNTGSNAIIGGTGLLVSGLGGLGSSKTAPILLNSDVSGAKSTTGKSLFTFPTLADTYLSGRKNGTYTFNS